MRTCSIHSVPFEEVNERGVLAFQRLAVGAGMMVIAMAMIISYFTHDPMGLYVGVPTLILTSIFLLPVDRIAARVAARFHR